MKKLCCLLVCFLLVLPAVFSQDNEEDEEDTTYSDKVDTKTKAMKLEPLLGYTFSNRGGWSNITPEIFLGFDTLVYKTNNGIYDFRFRFGPTICAANNQLDTSRNFRALMMPGAASIALNISTSASCLNNRLKLIGTLGSTLKLVGYAEHSQSITQNNIRAAAGFQLPGLFLFTAEHTWGWHNITDESEIAFKQLFATENTAVRYLTLTVEGYSEAMNMFLFCSWRKFLNHFDFSPEYWKDTRIISIGVRKDIDLLSHATGR